MILKGEKRGGEYRKSRDKTTDRERAESAMNFIRRQFWKLSLKTNQYYLHNIKFPSY